MSEIAAVLIGGPPATGKSTLAMALAPRLDAAVLDLDVATAPLTRVVSELTGLHDLDDPALAGLTRDARYDTLLDLAAANLAAARPVVLVAPFTLERSRVSAWAATAKRIPAPATMVWLYLPPGELVRRLTERGLARDESKLRDPASYLTGLDLEPPVVPHLALDASRPTAALVSSVLDHLSRQGALRGVGFPAKARYGGGFPRQGALRGRASPPRRVTSGLADAFSLLCPSCDTDIAADHGYCV